MKILLISGHGAGDVGACGNGYREADLTREVVNTLAPKLRQYAQVDIYPQSRNAYTDVNRGNLAVNFANYNYVFEVHFNAGGGKGTEIYVTREEAGTKVEQKVMDKLSNYFSVRGVKRKNFNVIARAKRSGVSSALLETCFIDNANNVNTYKSNVNGICQAICDGIAEGFGLKKNSGNISSIPQNVDTNKAGSYVVNTSLNVRTGAGTNYKIVTTLKTGSLQGVDYVQGDWGHLLNGAGWIHLGYCSKVSRDRAGSYEVTASVLNVRQSPNTSSKVVSKLNRGSKQGVSYNLNNWGYLLNGAGWICLDYCKK